MIRKSLTVAAVAAVAVGLAASPAMALSYVLEPNAPGVPHCSSTQTTLQTWKIDNPRKSGFQQWGTLKVYQAKCYKTATDAGFTGVWTEARLDFAPDALKTGITVESEAGNPYRLTDWDSRGAGYWHDSPALQRLSGSFVLPDVATSADGALDLYNI